jgi:hypothetical protein
MNYILACFFGLFALLPLARAVSDLRSGVVDLKLYLPLARRSERTVLYWVFVCGNLVAFALLLFAAAVMLRRTT